MSLREILARVERLRDALEDGDTFFAETVLRDLLDDLWAAIGAMEEVS